jgi:hypothetical protein
MQAHITVIRYCDCIGLLICTWILSAWYKLFNTDSINEMLRVNQDNIIEHGKAEHYFTFMIKLDN